MVYMGSTIVYGRAVAVVTATGMDTEMGKIADALSQAQEGQTPLQRKLTQLSKVLTKLVIGICVLVFAIQMIRAGSLNFEVALNSFMIAGFPCSGGDPGRTCGSCDSGTFHRCNEHVKTKRDHPPADCSGNPWLCPGDLLG